MTFTALLKEYTSCFKCFSPLRPSLCLLLPAQNINFQRFKNITDDFAM